MRVVMIYSEVVKRGEKDGAKLKAARETICERFTEKEGAKQVSPGP